MEDNISELEAAIQDGLDVEEIVDNLSHFNCVTEFGMEPDQCSGSDCYDCWIKCVNKKITDMKHSK